MMDMSWATLVLASRYPLEVNVLNLKQNGELSRLPFAVVADLRWSLALQICSLVHFDHSQYITETQIELASHAILGTVNLKSEMSEGQQPRR